MEKKEKKKNSGLQSRVWKQIGYSLHQGWNAILETAIGVEETEAKIRRSFNWQDD